MEDSVVSINKYIENNNIQGVVQKALMDFIILINEVINDLYYFININYVALL